MVEKQFKSQLDKVQELEFIITKEEKLVKQGKQNLQKMASSGTASDHDLRSAQREMDRKRTEV